MWSTCPREMLPLRHFTVKLNSHILVTWRVRTTLWSKKLYHAGWNSEVFVDPQIWSLWQLTSRSSEKRRRHFRASVFQFLLTFSEKVLVLARCCSCSLWVLQLIATAEQDYVLRQTQLRCIDVRGLCWKSLVTLRVLRATQPGVFFLLIQQFPTYVIPSYAMSDLSN
jgi:hypothetical protein